MSQPFFFPDEEAFHSAQRARLLDPMQMPPFEGDFADAVKAKIDRLLPNQLRQPRGASEVLHVFSGVPMSEVRRLFFVVEEALKASNKTMDADARRWAVELACYCGIRCIDFKAWAAVPVHLRSESGKSALVSGPTVKGMGDQARMLSTLVMAGLAGQVVTLGQGRAPDGVYALNLSSPDTLSDPVDGWLGHIYDSLFTTPPNRRTQPEQRLTEFEVQRLKAEIEYQRDVSGKWWAAHVDTTGLANDEAMDRLSTLLKQLEVTVVSEQLDPQSLFTGPGFVGAQAYLERILKVLPDYAQPSPPPAAPPPATAAPSPFMYDAFISHASEDKGLVVQPLVDELKKQGLRIWYDRESMGPGDLLSREINQALTASRVVVLVLSRDYFNKPWAQAEMDAAQAMEMDRPSGAPSRLLCVWHGVGADFVLAKAPMLGARIGLTTRDGIAPLATKLAHLLRSDL